MQSKVLDLLMAAALLVLDATAQVGQVQGRVRDADGAPIAGARVSIDVRYGDSAFRSTCEAFLRNHPLTDVRTTRDGTYVLLVPPEHAEIGSLGLDWWLVVEAAGYQPWRERLRNGLSGCRGSDVCLPTAAAEDFVTLRRGENTAPEDWLGGVKVSRGRGESLVVELDAEGRARALLPHLPQPLQPAYTPSDLTWRVNTNIVRPEHVLPPSEAPLTPVQRTDGAPPAAARALVWNGAYSRLVDLPRARLRSSSDVLAVGAEGCRWSTTAQLTPLPATPPRHLRIVDAEGRPVPAARALLLAAIDWRPPHTRFDSRPGARALWRRPRSVDSDGILELGELPTDDPTVLLVSAPGFASHTELDPRGCADRASITLQRRACASVVVAARDTAGKPIAGARVYVGDRADLPCNVFGEPLRTGADGTVAIDGMPLGPHDVHVTADGFAPRSASVVVKAEPLAIPPFELDRSKPSIWQVRTLDGDRPAPFATVLVLHNDRGRLVCLPGNLGGFWQADARGELLLPIAACGRTQRVHVGASRRPEWAAGCFIAGASSAARARRIWHRGESQAPADLARAARIRSTCSPLERRDAAARGRDRPPGAAGCRNADRVGPRRHAIAGESRPRTEVARGARRPEFDARTDRVDARLRPRWPTLRRRSVPRRPGEPRA